MLLTDFDYALPEELIAQEPLAERDQSRLLVVDRRKQTLEHKKFFDILDYLRDDDLMVFNDTRVVAARLFGQKETGGKVEALLMKRHSARVWEAMVKPGRRVGVGSLLIFERGLRAEVVDRTAEGGRILHFTDGPDPDEVIASVGQVPLPPYIHKRLEDPERYQTVYAMADGSAAAPTAGLHFTPDLLERIQARDIRTAYVTLHIGIATFRPVRTADIEDHEMHTESYEISPESAEAINTAPGRIVCVGTTTARALESAATGKRRVAAGGGETNLFIRPPYSFKIVEALVTNFHVPKSTLLILVSAFEGTELIRRAYEEAIRERYRFLSFGDAMFLC
ncbi:MAG: tRNA preQ1(34) S-adenosylmethionine ribosyltransferase-isomerase QueA [Armatimonadetes bacterium]|nr:tRNA preQ1(34) S-adenosylmethionine ribosyltransferase-isomerase QueA [Armatimonadota bacterium]